MLKRGITITRDDNYLISDAICINSGSIPFFKMSDICVTDYIKDAYVPKNDWVEINSYQKDILINKGANLDVKSNIHLLRLNSELIDLFRMLDINNISNIQQLQNSFKNKIEVVQLLQDSLIGFIQRYESQDKHNSSFIQGFHFSSPGQHTLAINKKKERLGLHIDYCAESHKFNNYNSVNRVSINLSNEDRYFVFLNLSTSQLIDYINQFEEYDFYKGFNSLDLPTLTSMAFKYLADYPLIRLKIRPFEGYIAPTDNIIHDGSTLGKMNWDCTLSILGYYKVPETP